MATRLTYVPLILICVVSLNCDRKREARKPAPPTPDEQQDRGRFAALERAWAAIPLEIPGTWEASAGKGTLRSHMVLELRPDQTFKLTNSITGGPGSDGDVTNVSEGHWRLKWDTLILSLERLADGRPIPADKKEAQFVVSQDKKGDRIGGVRKLTMTPHGPDFTRRTGAGATSQP